ncbi:MAG: NADPH-dependent FMN reductase family protein, partial [Ruminiclostridium sp.]
DSEFEPMFTSCEKELKGKKIALFGSYGWGNGEWMRNWEETCISDGAIIVCDSVICNEAPDAEASKACKSLGAILAKA